MVFSALLLAARAIGGILNLLFHSRVADKFPAVVPG
jgi:hypothetical protein